MGRLYKVNIQVTHQDRKLKAIHIENRKCTTKQIHNKCAERAVNVCQGTVRNQMNKIIFLCRKSEQKLALTPKQKKTKLQ